MGEIWTICHKTEPAVEAMVNSGGNLNKCYPNLIFCEYNRDFPVFHHITGWGRRRGKLQGPGANCPRNYFRIPPPSVPFFLPFPFPSRPFFLPPSFSRNGPEFPSRGKRKARWDLSASEELSCSYMEILHAWLASVAWALAVYSSVGQISHLGHKSCKTSLRAGRALAGRKVQR